MTPMSGGTVLAGAEGLKSTAQPRSGSSARSWPNKTSSGPLARHVDAGGSIQEDLVCDAPCLRSMKLGNLLHMGGERKAIVEPGTHVVTDEAGNMPI
jgi:hypothetical protein